MSLAEKLKQFFASEEVQPLLEESKEYAIVESPKATSSGKNESLAVQGNATAIYEAERARAEKAEAEAEAARAELAKVKEEKLSAEADAFIEAEVKAGRMIPAEKDDFKLLYLQAAKDDAEKPLKESSRVENLKAIQEKRKPHNLTKEVLDPKKGLQVLPGEDSPTAKIEREAEEQAEAYVKTIGGGKPRLEAVK